MSTAETAYLGRPTSRVDGPAKVTGAAKYAAEYFAEGLTYGVVVSATIAKGRIKAIDATEALKVPGVVHVLSHENAPRTAWFDKSYRDTIAPAGVPFRPLQADKVVFNGQPIALVVAETFEAARHAASLVAVEYREEAHATDIHEARAAGKVHEPAMGKIGYVKPPSRGHAEAALAKSAVSVDATYFHPDLHHNPMEPYASTVVPGLDGVLTVYDKTQGSQNVRDYLVNVFGLKEDEVRVVAKFVGGAFGSGLRPQYQVVLAVMAARVLNRPVRVVLTRQQMFTLGYRAATIQRVALGSDAAGQLDAIVHQAWATTSRFEDFTESVVHNSAVIYRAENVQLDYKMVPLDLFTPIDMRAPGTTSGMFALESAMDELAAKLGVDPLTLRLDNYAEVDPSEDKPFSSKELRACYLVGAERFGWSKRTLAPRSMRDGHALIGWGMATGLWDAQQNPAEARAVLTAGGKLDVSSATTDIGTGTYTVMTQVAAETLGLPLADVTFHLGDSDLPTSPVQGGSWTTATIGPAVRLACLAVGEKLLKLAKKAKGSPLGHAGIDEVEFVDGRIVLKGDPSKGVSITGVMQEAGVDAIEESAKSKPEAGKQAKFSRFAHSAVFAEVRVDEDYGTISVPRVVIAVAGGRILNPKTARSQILGAIVMGIGMALEEESKIDHAFGRFMNHNLAEYHVPVNADIGEIDVTFVEERDEVVNALGVKGIGEIGLVGIAAAVANAVYHATGRRVRDLPITLDKLL